MIALAIMLGSSCAASWTIAGAAPGGSRAHIRFACILYAALALAAAIGPALAETVMLIVSPLCAALLLFAVAAGLRRPVAPVLASILLAAAALSGMFAAASGFLAAAFAPMLAFALAAIAASLSGFGLAPGASVRSGFAAAALVAGQSAYASGEAGGLAALLGFTAAGLLGMSLATIRRSKPVVEKHRAGVLALERTIGDPG
ncbi:MAG TPA: hypothetical protein VG819_02670 [Rhizomicrobium sp.]|nr:hypothetical protein [Rhizomicrobium sp.]